MPFDNGGPPPRPGGPTGPGAKPPMKKSTRNWLIVGGLGAAALVIWYVMKSRSAASQSATSAGYDPNAIDPNTGMTYAQEAAGLGGYASGVTPSLYGYVDPSTGAYITGAGAGSSVLQPSTNASWAQQVEAYLQTLGYDPTAVGAAIGKYLTGQGLTSDQQGIVAAALAFFGQPPQGAPPPVTTPPSGNGGGGGVTGKYKTLIVPKNETFAQYAKQMHWTAATEKLIELLNSIGPNTKLRKGERIIRPAPAAPATSLNSGNMPTNQG